MGNRMYGRSIEPLLATKYNSATALKRGIFNRWNPFRYSSRTTPGIPSQAGAEKIYLQDYSVVGSVMRVSPNGVQICSIEIKLVIAERAQLVVLV